ncbi:class I SAM-dependent methyltransferase [Aestuariibius sp. 2305UL40-4]|uniref:class I SAM-dependent methyltransferase n=1 Tax=Aestuariibius violaceus TaxID=3234132 RepID=UPI00345ECB8F
MSNADQAAYWASQTNWATHQSATNAIMRPVLDLVLRHAGLSAGSRILDIGCGTGASVLAAASIAGPDGAVFGIDISPTLLAVARDRLKEVPQAHIIEADAQVADLPPECDALISRFGVMFFSDTTAAFANIAKALRPGARLTMAAWAHPAGNPWFKRPAEVAASVLGPQPKTDRTAPGPFAWEDPARILPMLEAAGLAEVRCKEEGVDLTSDTAKSAAQLSLVLGPAAAALRQAEANQAQQAAVLAGLEEMYRDYETGAGIRIPARINLYTARVSA